MSLKKLAKQIKQEQKERGKPDSERFIDMLDKYLVSKEGDKRRVGYHPSSFYKCSRQLVYSIRYPEIKGKRYARTERIFGVGHAIHNWMQQLISDVAATDGFPVRIMPPSEIPALRRSTFKLVDEREAHPLEVEFLDTTFTELHPITGMVDGLLSFNNQNMVLEIKTINTGEFNLMIQPKKEHIIQGALYATVLEIPKVLFLYIDKNSQHLKAYIHEYTDAHKDWVTNKLDLLEMHLKDGTIPEGEPSDQCKWCPFKQKCEKGEL